MFGSSGDPGLSPGPAAGFGWVVIGCSGLTWGSATREGPAPGVRNLRSYQRYLVPSGSEPEVVTRGRGACMPTRCENLNENQNSRQYPTPSALSHESVASLREGAKGWRHGCARGKSLPSGYVGSVYTLRVAATSTASRITSVSWAVHRERRRTG